MLVPAPPDPSWILPSDMPGSAEYHLVVPPLLDCWPCRIGAAHFPHLTPWSMSVNRKGPGGHDIVHLSKWCWALQTSDS